MKVWEHNLINHCYDKPLVSEPVYLSDTEQNPSQTPELRGSLPAEEVQLQISDRMEPRYPEDRERT